jgi:hypothetical protein
VAQIVPNSSDAESIDAALAAWRQGDMVFGRRLFTYVGNPAKALTPECADGNRFLAKRLVHRCLVFLRLAPDNPEAGQLQAVGAEVEGLVVLSQTCDIVRSCTERHFIEVAPLVIVSESMLRDIKKGRRPVYAFVPGATKCRLVADLDRIMTIEKSVVAEWVQKKGCSTDQEVREFAQALTRKRARFAFPDDFTLLVRKLQSRLQEKHEKDTDEGRALRALREIRVRAAPSWDAEKVDILFWFVRNDDTPEFEGKAWFEHLEAWLKLVLASGRFEPVEGQVTTLDDLSARDYVESDPLDLDHLSL